MFNKKIFVFQILILSSLSIIIPIIVVNMLLTETKMNIDTIQQDIQRLYQNNSTNNTIINDKEKEILEEIVDQVIIEDAVIETNKNIETKSIVKSTIDQYEEVQKELDLLHESFNIYENDGDIPEDMLKKESALQQKLDELFESL